jgi:uncharacterized cupredoxin-like copper-binding protein
VRLRFGIVLMLTAVSAVACGGDGHEGHGGSGSSSGAGAPADAAGSDRTVEVEAMDTLRFDPQDIEVTVGETVTFSVTNAGDLEHEFVIGDHADSMGDDMMGDDSMNDDMMHGGGALLLDGGSTGEVTWTFTDAGELGFACYIDGHNASGMEGTITITE